LEVIFVRILFVLGPLGAPSIKEGVWLKEILHIMKLA